MNSVGNMETNLHLGMVWSNAEANQPERNGQRLVHINDCAWKLGQDAVGSVEASGTRSNNGQAERVIWLASLPRAWCGGTHPAERGGGSAHPSPGWIACRAEPQTGSETKHKAVAESRRFKERGAGAELSWVQSETGR